VDRSSLGKLIAVHAVSPVHQQRAAIVAGLAFLFFLAMILLVYVRGHFGYFLLSTAFLALFIFTMTGWWMQRRNVVEVFDRGLIFRKFVATWDEIAAVGRDRDGTLKLTNKAKDTIAIPKTIHALDDLEAYIRSRSRYK
jgi:hypothetical protein